MGFGTLLSPEASAVRQVSLEGRWSLLPPSWVLACDALVARVGGLVSCELDSGREHLGRTPLFWPFFGVGGCGRFSSQQPLMRRGLLDV